MYYEEKTIDGVRCVRSSPTGAWTPRDYYVALDAMNQLEPGYRVKIMSRFCSKCGLIKGPNHICPKEIP